MSAPGEPRPMSALDEIALEQRFPALIPGLVRRGLSFADAAALAHNATLLSLVLPGFSDPWRVLGQLSLGDIARLCEQVETRTDPQWECGWNRSFEEETP